MILCVLELVPICNSELVSNFCVFENEFSFVGFHFKLS